MNFPLPEAVDGERYLELLRRAVKRIASFKPKFLVVSLGLDTAKGDPTGTWSLLAKDFEKIGMEIGSLRIPTLVVQEGGYRSRVIGVHARRFFTGLSTAAHRL